ncbi:MAG: GIY-YIG nuclease family protein [Candidatus Staskawiczbacteria bacterium]|nr:GIY-YIG nuclease family protein [Candidatus Staskawiczbacteria bacterium]
MHTVYILKSEKDKKLYIGSTGSLIRRLQEHENGLVNSTRHRRPLRLIYREDFTTGSEALDRERYFKGGGKARKLLDDLINKLGD